MINANQRGLGNLLDMNVRSIKAIATGRVAEIRSLLSKLRRGERPLDRVDWGELRMAVLPRRSMNGVAPLAHLESRSA